MTSFHKKLRQLMELRGLTQAEVAKDLGSSQRSVSGWINGAVPRPATIVKIAAYFEISVGALKNDNLELPPPPPTKCPSLTRLEMLQVMDCVVKDYLTEELVALSRAAKELPKERLHSAAHILATNGYHELAAPLRALAAVNSATRKGS